MSKPDIRDDDRIKKPAEPKPPITPKSEPLPSVWFDKVVTKLYSAIFATV